MSRQNDHHVVPDEAGGWNVTRENGERASSHHATQDEATARAHEIVTNAGGGEVVIHAQDGTIREKLTVGGGSDPNPPAG
jgi:Uncharacterized protein conserved in bacteria (DUF2188)